MSATKYSSLLCSALQLRPEIGRRRRAFLLHTTSLNSAIFGLHRMCWRKPAARWCHRNIVLRNSSAVLSDEASSKPSDMEVKLREVSMVKPLAGAESNPPSSSYFLSNLDVPLAPVSLEVVFFFEGDAPKRRDDDPAKVMKEALERVLVHYYPLAGRLVLDPLDGRPFVVCNGEGVCFVEADANIQVVDLGDLGLPNPAAVARLVYRIPASLENPPLLTVQVTRFKCGGFVLGVVFSHAMMDGAGASNFINSWAETARGVRLSVPPVLDRTHLKARTPLQVNYSHREYTEMPCNSQDVNAAAAAAGHVIRSFRFTPANLAALRRHALEDGVLPRCTAFEALSGLLWKVKTVAMHLKPEQQVKLVVAFDGRLAKGAGIPEGYIGNVVTLTAAITSAGELEENPLSYAVKHAQDAIKRLTGDYLRSQLDFLECEGGLRLPSFTASTVISLWSRLSIFGADFGWGKLTHVFPAGSMYEAFIILPHGEDGKGMNVVVCNPPEVLEKTHELLSPYIG